MEQISAKIEELKIEAVAKKAKPWCEQTDEELRRKELEGRWCGTRGCELCDEWALEQHIRTKGG
jgi:hypothetical protein